jgi:hypothetical protein
MQEIAQWKPLIQCMTTTIKIPQLFICTSESIYYQILNRCCVWRRKFQSLPVIFPHLSLKYFARARTRARARAHTHTHTHTHTFFFFFFVFHALVWNRWELVVKWIVFDWDTESNYSVTWLMKSLINLAAHLRISNSCHYSLTWSFGRWILKCCLPVCCGLEYQRLSTEISSQAWCDGSGEGKRLRAGRESCFPTSTEAVGSTSVSTMPSRLCCSSERPCTESSGAEDEREQLVSEECGRSSWGTSGEQISSQVLQLS